jgi:hypothetical protein
MFDDDYDDDEGDFWIFGKKDRWGIYKSFLTLVDEEVGLLL